jgi:hypothetical protein
LSGFYGYADEKTDKHGGSVDMQSVQASQQNNLLECTVSPSGQLTVMRDGTDFAWQGDTLAVVSWSDKKGTENSQSVSVNTGWTINVASNGRGYNVDCHQPKLGISFLMELAVNGDVLTVSIPAAQIREDGAARIKTLKLLPAFGAATKGEEGYLVIPKDVGIISYFNEKKPAEYQVPVYGFFNCNMPVFGINRGDKGLLGIITSGQFDAFLNVSTNWGQEHLHSIGPGFSLRSTLEDTRLSDDLTVQYHFLSPDDAGWSGAAKRYRAYNFETRGIRPLNQRAAKSPELAYAAQALEVRLRLGVKPVPYEISEQTLANEPPVKVFLTFEQVRDIIDEFHKQGLDYAELCLVGWNIGGHDGRYPQIFPVEPKLGGEEELKKTIKHGQSLGYQMVAHNCYWDAYRISEDWDEAHLRKNSKGELRKGGQWGGGQSYRQCLSRSYDLFAKRDLPKIRELGFRGLHYTDVISIGGPDKCYDEAHPVTKREDAEAGNKILELSSEIFGGVQSEGPLDFTAGILDRVLYVDIHFKETHLKDIPYLDDIVPFYPAVYHGTLLYTIWNECVNSGPGDTAYLKNIEYGGMPLAYFYGHFLLDKSKDWMGNNDLQYDDKKELEETVAGLKQVYDDLQQLKHLQMEFIEEHKQLDEGVFKTVFSNGESLVVNYNPHPYKLSSGKEAPARGFFILND